MTQLQVINLMRSARSEADWNNKCDIVKKAFSGSYPDWWFSTVIQSGLMTQVRQSWPKR